MEKYILIHIPHSSLFIPEDYKSKSLISREELDKENKFMCDYRMNEFFDNKQSIVFPYSRLYCDIERFRDSSEVMNKYGMGYIYTKTSTGEDMFNPSLKDKKKINKIYDNYHEDLNNKVSKVLDKYNKCIIIDLHSYSSELVSRLFDCNDSPDICLGVEEDYYSKEIVDYLIDSFKSYGYTIEINYPYSGSLVPNKFYGRKNTNIVSIMIEVNKRVYLDDFDKFKKILNDIINKIR